jgi:hypothetical protein
VNPGSCSGVLGKDVLSSFDFVFRGCRAKTVYAEPKNKAPVQAHGAQKQREKF